MSLEPDGSLPLGQVESRTKHHYICSGCLIDRLGSGLRHGRLHRLTMEKVTTLKWLPEGRGHTHEGTHRNAASGDEPGTKNDGSAPRRIEVWSLDTANAVPCFGNAAPCLETARSPCPTSVSLPARSQRGQSIRTTFKGNSPSEREPCRIALFDRGHRLSGHPGKGLNFSFQGVRLGGEAPMLKRVPIATGSPAAGPVHPADARSPHRRRSARLPAPLRFGVASQRPAHIQEHGVEPPIFSAPLPPRPRR